MMETEKTITERGIIQHDEWFKILVDFSEAPILYKKQLEYFKSDSITRGKNRVDFEIDFDVSKYNRKLTTETEAAVEAFWN